MLRVKGKALSAGMEPLIGHAMCAWRRLQWLRLCLGQPLHSIVVTVGSFAVQSFQLAQAVALASRRGQLQYLQAIPRACRG